MITAHLIDKSALVAEIEKKIKQYEKAFDDPSFASYEAYLIAKGKYRKLLDILQFINTLEVKEVDLDVMQRIEECPYRQVGCTMYEGKILECKGSCSWVVDYPKLKELKARKGE